MIHTVHYEPQGQRQRLEPREPQENDLEQRPLLQVILHLNLGARLRRTEHAPVARVTTIFAALMGALFLALGPDVWTQVSVRAHPTPEALFGLAGYLVFAGALLGGLPLVVSAWRTSPRSRFLFLVPILTSLLLIACSLLIAFMTPLGILGPQVSPILPALLFYGGTVVSTIAITRAIRQATIADTWLRFATHLSRLVVVGMVLMFVGVVLWGGTRALVAPGWFAVLVHWLLFAFGMFLAMMVALWASIFQVQPPASQPRPREAENDH